MVIILSLTYDHRPLLHPRDIPLAILQERPCLGNLSAITAVGKSNRCPETSPNCVTPGLGIVSDRVPGTSCRFMTPKHTGDLCSRQYISRTRYSLPNREIIIWKLGRDVQRWTMKASMKMTVAERLIMGAILCRDEWKGQLKEQQGPPFRSS